MLPMIVFGPSHGAGGVGIEENSHTEKTVQLQQLEPSFFFYALPPSLWTENPPTSAYNVTGYGWLSFPNYSAVNKTAGCTH